MLSAYMFMVLLITCDYNMLIMLMGPLTWHLMKSSFTQSENMIMMFFILCIWSTHLSIPSFEENMMFIMAKTILILSIIFFSTNNNIMFFMSFELVLIPIALMIIIFGVQSERLMASVYMLLYTTVLSMPLFMMLMECNLFSLQMQMKILSSTQIIFMLTAFLVKLPSWFLHTWLPKAHVESPTSGSIILAAVLLKMGSLGIIRLMNNFSQIYWVLISIAMMGSIGAALMSTLQSDMKKLIAYSSVSHMNFTLLFINMLMSTSKISNIYVIITHGISSGLMFFTMGNLSHSNQSRNILLSVKNKKMGMEEKLLILLTLTTNCAVPSTVQFYPEMFTMMALFSMNILGLISASTMMMLICYFSMIMYMMIQSKTTSNNCINKNTLLVNSIQNFNLSMLLWAYCFYS